MLEDFRLKVFIAVAEAGSFTAAAKVLGISQPAVSQNISMLEKELDVILFSRVRGEVGLTGEGKVFKDYAEKILYWYSAAGEMFGDAGRLNSGRPIRIAADSLVASYILAPALSHLSVAQPTTLFEISVSTLSADAEISIAPSPKSIDFDSEANLLGIMEAAVVTAPTNNIDSTLTSASVSNRFAVWEGYRSFLGADIIARTSVFSDSVDVIKTIVLDSVDLVAIVPEITVANELASAKLIQLPVSLPEFAYDIHFKAAADFAGKSICGLILKTLKETLNLK